jgi:hypothetical protein
MPRTRLSGGGQVRKCPLRAGAPPFRLKPFHMKASVQNTRYIGLLVGMQCLGACGGTDQPSAPDGGVAGAAATAGSGGTGGMQAGGSGGTQTGAPSGGTAGASQAGTGGDVEAGAGADDGGAEDGGEPDAGADASGSDAGPLRWTPTDAVAWYAADFSDSVFANGAKTEVAAEGEGVALWANLLEDDTADCGTALDGITKSSIDGKPSVRFSDGTALQCSNLTVATETPAITVVAIYHATSTPNSADIWAASTAGGSTVRATLFRSVAGDTSKGIGGRQLDADAFTGADAGFALQDNVSQVSIGVLDYANAAIRLYVNGATPTAENTLPSAGLSADTASGNVWLGTKHGLQANAFHGHLHEVVVYRRVITAQEIQDIVAHASEYWGVALD